MEAFEGRHLESEDGTKSKASYARALDDGNNRGDHLKWLLKHLDDIENESRKQYTEGEWRETILNLRSPDYRPPESSKAVASFPYYLHTKGSGQQIGLGMALKC